MSSYKPAKLETTAVTNLYCGVPLLDGVDLLLDGVDLLLLDGVDLLLLDGVDLLLDGVDVSLDGVDVSLDGVDLSLDGVLNLDNMMQNFSKFFFIIQSDPI